MFLLTGLPRPDRFPGIWARLLLLAAVRQETHHVREPEAAIAAAADTEEWELAAIAEALHGVDVEVEHLRDLARGEERP